MDGVTGGPFLRKPLASFLDLDRDGKPELVVQEQVHNGTPYNAVVYNYFYILSDSSLRRFLARETRFSIPGMGQESWIIR